MIAEFLVREATSENVSATRGHMWQDNIKKFLKALE
jgi:hypothetical protein